VSLHYQKRVNIGKGFGLNISHSGISSSYRTKYGSIGSRSFSIKTGIPGLSYRGNWAKGKNGLVILLIYVLIVFSFLIAYNVTAFLIHILVKVFYLCRSWFLNRNHRDEFNNGHTAIQHKSSL
jgi:Protein of unknown function (DUF4236)